SHRATGARWNWPPNARSNRSPFLRSAAAHTGTRCAWRLRSLWPPFAASRDSRCSRRYCSPALAQTCTKRMKRHWLRRRTKRSSSAVVGGRRNRFLGHLEDLAQVGDVRGIVVHRLGWLVADLGDRLAVASRHLDHDLQRVVAQVVGEVGSDAEGGLAPPLE